MPLFEVDFTPCQAKATDLFHRSFKQRESSWTLPLTLEYKVAAAMQKNCPSLPIHAADFGLGDCFREYKTFRSFNRNKVHFAFQKHCFPPAFYRKVHA
jgi:hypothetical protein